MTNYKVVEIFSSINGEGTRAGQLAVFVRMQGCNLNCTYCDTKWANEADAKFHWTSTEEILELLRSMEIKNVTITGGEPLLQEEIGELLEAMAKEENLRVEIETNGSVPIDKYISNKNILITMDYKLPSSGVEKNMNLNNLEKLRKNDVLKLVIGIDDFDRIYQVIEKFSIKSYIYLSPVFGEIELFEIVDFMKIMHTQGIDTSKMRVQVQLHKIIWNPNERGV